ncbi:M56 family metallopeptidase [Aquimarina hainanensis]|uniref:M56 family metallopeptidase n=1 Tax=Aquimarina hainanensis TaxID=1578017 RepID=A0ABW5N2J6_9FLAO
MMVYYVFQTLIFQLLFLAVYELFLRKETFFNANRGYLLLTPILSLLMPFVHIGMVKQTIPDQYVIALPEILLTGDPVTEHSYPGLFAWIFSIEVWGYVWGGGALVCLLLFVWKLYKILKMKQNGEITRTADIHLVSLPDTAIAFSFLHLIFMGKKIPATQREHILLHEKVHADQYHSLDLLFFELLRVFFWFNPLLYLYQKRITVLHEYIADAKAVKLKGKKEYYQTMLSQVFQIEKISFINTFFNHSLIKKRIIMLQKSKSRKIVQLKYLILVPLILGMVVYTSCTQETMAQGGEMTGDQHKKVSTMMQRIEDLKEEMQKQGNMTEEEEKALKLLLLYTTEGSLKNPFFNDVHDLVEIPFGVIDKVPVYPGCEGMTKEETKKCFSQKLSAFVSSEFDTGIAERNNLTGEQKVAVHFKIDKTGKVGGLKIKTDSEELRKEAVRLMKALPVMIPGEQDGVKIGVAYTLPIKFTIKK